jgi:hypothetical protein
VQRARQARTNLQNLGLLHRNVDPEISWVYLCICYAKK